jgi:nucleoid DNA-binding protein
MIIPTLIRALVEDKSVAISGFGTFYVKNVSSQIREDIIYPPQNMVEFEFSKEVEDFSFVSKLSQWEQIRIDEAQDKISEWVSLIEKGLEHNKSVFFDDFGTFSKDANEKIVFQGMIIPQLNIENEGLEPVILYPKNKEEDMQKPVTDKREVLVRRKRKRDSAWFVSIIGVALLLLVALFFKDKISDIYKNIVTKENAVVETRLIASLPDETSPNEILPNNTTEESLPENILNDETPIDETLTPNETTANALISLSAYTELYLPYQKGSFYIIAGSFMKEESALLHIKQKKLDKFNAKLIIHPDSPRIRVCIGIFDNEEEANKIAVQLDKNYWVLK